MLKRLRRYKIECLMIAVALVITIISVIMLIHEQTRASEEELEIGTEYTPTLRPAHYVVDISGAIEKPGVYEISSGARLNNVLEIAGGLSEEADRDYFRRNYNLARFIADQEKIYIPSLAEIQNGVFTESQKTTYDIQLTRQESLNSSYETVNINTATAAELDNLNGVGSVTADKIIKNRPYTIIEELLTKKVVGKSLYQKIKDFITI